MRGEESPCLAHVADVFVACEQSLDLDSRVKLTRERDRFGLRKAELDWRLSEMDLRTLRTAASEAAQRLAELDVGRMQIVEWLLGDGLPSADQLYGGNHHMGTTRMSDDPKTGVVECRHEGSLARKPLHRRQQRIRHLGPRQPDLHHRAAGASPGGPSR